MTTISGIPAHALLVHGVVVLAPLTAVLAILCGLWRAARARLTWLVLTLAVVVVALTPLTTAAGEWLYRRESQHSPVLQLHAERGGWMIFLALGLLVVAVVLVLQHRLESRSSDSHRWLAVTSALLAVVIGVSSIVGVVQIGHSGAEAKWGTIAAE